MDRRTFVKLSGAGAVSLASPAPTGTQLARQIIPLDADWRFSLGDFEGAEQPGFADAGWRLVDVPHDWSIEGPFAATNPSRRSGGFAPTGIGWYRKTFRAPESEGDRAGWVEFDGVYENATVWINGHQLGIQRYGYSSFHFDLTGCLRLGADNILAVRVDNSRQPNCRWYSGSGIYRHVRLVTTGRLHVAHWGTYVTTPKVESRSATVRIRTTVRNENDAPAKCTLRTSIHDPAGGVAGSTVSSAEIPAGADHVFDQEVQVAPQLWSTATPVMYKARSEVSDGRGVADEYETPLGIRTAEFDKDRGFLLNGEPVKMKGVCLHHDGGCLGAAVPARAWERRLETLKSIGCNAIRTSHNPPAPEFLDLCDRMGFLVIDEAFDKWDTGGKQFMPIEWPDRWPDDLRAMLERDRNHPSIVLWSVGNETAQPGDENLIERLDQLVGFVHREESTRPVSSALIAVLQDVSEEVKAEKLLQTSEHVDVLCLNYQEQWFEEIRKRNPNTVVVSTEAFAYYRGGRGELMSFHEQNPWYDVVKHDYAAGQFLWPGIDYLGESMGWPSKGWPTGLIDTCGFLKPYSGFHRAVWNPAPSVKLAVQHDGLDRDNGREHWHWPKLAAHWNFESLVREPLRLHVFTNCETVELVVNGKSMGVRETADFPNNTITWYAVYRPGKVEAIGRNGDREVARDALLTAGKPAGIQLLADRVRMAADGEDLSHIEARLIDPRGTLVPDADQRITFAVRGAGRLLGVDNGNLRCEESYQAPYRTTRWGRCLAVVEARREPGSIRVTARADNLPEASVEIRTS